MEDSQLKDQFVGSGLANLVMLMVLGIGWSVRRLCDRSKCKSHLHCCCLDMDLRDDSYRTNAVDVENPKGGETNASEERNRQNL